MKYWVVVKVDGSQIVASSSTLMGITAKLAEARAVSGIYERTTDTFYIREVWAG